MFQKHTYLAAPNTMASYFLLLHIFLDSDYRPDMMKIYPTLVMPGTKLWDEWKKGKFSLKKRT